MIGPATFNTNQKVGLLAEGDPAPQPMIPSNPLYYNDLMIKAGMQKHTDLYTFSWRTGTGLDSKMLSRAAGAGKMPGVDIKRLGADGSARETLLVRDLFNGSMSGNWGFIPLTTDESAAMLKYCRAHADPDLLITVWYRGRPAGLFIFLPTGLSPGASPTSVRAAVLGVLPPFRRTGLASYMIGYLEEIISRKGYRRVDLSMVHEENGTVLDLVSRTGAKAAGLFRVYGS
jgi:GNAT superfamily N-acetyltransferase